MKRILNFFLSQPLLTTIAIASILSLLSIQTIQSQTLGIDTEIYDVVIVGGGVSGCYCGWRIAEADAQEQKSSKKKPRTVHLYEMSDRIGGRLYTAFLPGMPHVPVELGAMHFRNTDVLTYNLATQLELKVVDYIPIASDNFYYLRGKRFRAHEITYQRAIPYDLKHHEEGKSPQELVVYAIENLISDFSTMPMDDLKKAIDALEFEGHPLKDVSWQNFLSSVLSAEAYQFLVDTGTIQVVNNISLASQIPLYIPQPSARALKISSGFQDLASTLVKKFESAGGEVHKKHRLKTFTTEKTIAGQETFFRLVFEHSNNDENEEVVVYAKDLILAMPKRSLELLDKENILLQDKKFVENMDSVNPFILTKLFFGYSDPWWRKLDLIAGKSVSDFELRTTHYFETEEEAPGGEKGNTNALLLASYQGARTPFWKAFAPGELFSGRKNFFVPPREDLIIKKIGISEFAVFQAQQMLKVLHGINTIPEPYTAAYFDWSVNPYGGAFAHWKIGVNPTDIIKKMRKPLSDYNLFICGCTFSDMQGWTEGALKTAELVLQDHFGLKRPDWLPESYKLEP